MSMRKPELTRGPSQRFLDDFLARSTPGVDPDRLSNSRWVDHASSDDVNAAREERIAKYDAQHAEELKPAGNGTYESHHQTFDAKVARDGTVQLHDKSDVDLNIGCLFGGCKMAVDDWLMRKEGIDPYSTEKMRWLDRTRDERAQIGLEHRKAQLQRSAQLMQQNLVWMWQKTRDPEERKRALFELWDEVAENGDDDLVRGGIQARAYLVGFVRTRLPAGSPDAFSDRELAELNAHRRSQATFAPYQ